MCLQKADSVGDEHVLLQNVPTKTKTRSGTVIFLVYCYNNYIASADFSGPKKDFSLTVIITKTFESQTHVQEEHIRLVKEIELSSRPSGVKLWKFLE